MSLSEGGTLSPDQVSVGVLVTQVPRDVIDPVVVGLGKQAKRSDGKLAAHVTAYLTMGLWLFPDDPYEEVATKVTGGLDRYRLLGRRRGVCRRPVGSPRPASAWGRR